MAHIAMNTLFDLSQGKQLENDIIGTNLLVHIKVPLILPELNVDSNQIHNLRYIGYVFFTISSIASIGTLLWTMKHSKVRVVTASQPLFLYMISIGILILSATIIPLSFDDGGHLYDYRGNLDLSLTSQEEADGIHNIAICMSIPWLALVGFAITFSSLFAKTWRINRIFHSQTFTRVQVPISDALTLTGVVVGCNVIILIIWTIIDPLIYTRQTHLGTDGWNRHISTYGQCKSESNVGQFLWPLVVINFIILGIANYQAYEARYIESEFAGKCVLRFHGMVGCV